MADFREPPKGMAKAVVERTYARTKQDGTLENWGEIADRVALGNTLLCDTHASEKQELRDHIAHARVLMSGRHLQQGDEDQPNRDQAVYTNCSTAATSFALFYLLLNGSGVGRDYSDAMMQVNWDMLPTVVPVIGYVPETYTGKYLSPGTLHPDAIDAWKKGFITYGDAVEEYAGTDIIYHDVEDSREGWAKVVEHLETLAFSGHAQSSTFIVDFSRVRPAGAPIGGMQNRPASGPVSPMEAIRNLASVKGKGWAPWKQTMHVDHYLADCVQVGGARRAARMSVKYYADAGAFEFIDIKREGGLWTSNNSLGVDAEFWANAKLPGSVPYFLFERAIEAAYSDGTGEPGFVNLDKLKFDETGIDVYDDGVICGSDKYELHDYTLKLTKALVAGWKQMKYKAIVNPCGEIVLNSLGGFCVIADVVPFHCVDETEMTTAMAAAARALIRVNTMSNFYPREVARTNRIGVGPTGFHEWAWRHFGYTWHDLVNENASKPFWEQVERLREVVIAAATEYSTELGMSAPHTFTTCKPAGTTSKCFALTEGVHLPAMKRYVRWVQFDKEASWMQIEMHRLQGYPIQDVVKDRATVSIIGFPTEPTITQLGIPDHGFVTAPEATMADQYKFLMLLEKYWLGERGNQVSYTLKFDPDKVDAQTFKKNVRRLQPLVRCCSLMVAAEAPAKLTLSREKYGYLPEDPVDDEAFALLTARITAAELEGFDPATFACSNGACPVL